MTRPRHADPDDIHATIRDWYLDPETTDISLKSWRTWASRHGREAGDKVCARAVNATSWLAYLTAYVRQHAPADRVYLWSHCASGRYHPTAERELRTYTVAHANVPDGCAVCNGGTSSRANPITSQLEQTLADALRQRGYPLADGKQAIWLVPRNNPRAAGTRWTPDLMIPEERIAIEVDFCAEVDPDSPWASFTHDNPVARRYDPIRNEFFADAGWRTLRVRLATTADDAIGAYDVTTGSRRITKPVIAAVAAALDDIRAGRPGMHRHVPARPRSNPKDASPNTAPSSLFD